MKSVDPEKISLIKLIGQLRPATVWGVLTVITVLLAGSFTLGYNVSSKIAEIKVQHLEAQADDDKKTILTKEGEIVSLNHKLSTATADLERASRETAFAKQQTAALSENLAKANSVVEGIVQKLAGTARKWPTREIGTINKNKDIADLTALLKDYCDSSVLGLVPQYVRVRYTADNDLHD